MLEKGEKWKAEMQFCGDLYVRGIGKITWKDKIKNEYIHGAPRAISVIEKIKKCHLKQYILMYKRVETSLIMILTEGSHVNELEKARD